MNVYEQFRSIIETVLADISKTGALPEGLDMSNIAVEPPRDASHGDIATNAALVLSKQAGMNPREIAGLLADGLRAVDSITAVDIAGPGFVNMTIDSRFWQKLVKEILSLGASYGDCDLGHGEPVNVEYVSANPTGPMHVGHVRGAVFGDALANLLAKAGYAVTKEYYINDAGSQIDVLARSAYLRYCQALGKDIGEIPEGLYPGDYLIGAGETLASKYGDKFLDQEESQWLETFRTDAPALMMEMIRDDLASLGVKQDVFFSERSLHSSGRIDQAIETLRKAGHVYEGVLEPPKGQKDDEWEPRPQTLFRATDFGDDVDRALKKSDGTYTYFAADIAYHHDKYLRGFNQQIDIWGADHGGYVKRVKAAVRAISDDNATFEAKLCQMVNLTRDGKPVKMSKRAGTFVTLREVVEEVGKDVTRFIMLTRKNDAPLEFDFAKVMEQSKDNPVFYVQYAHARVNSVMQRAKDMFADIDVSDAALSKADMSLLTSPAEIAMIQHLAAWPRLIESAALASEPHRIAFYLYEMASAFHSFWNRGNDNPDLRFVIEGDQAITLSRLALIRAIQSVIASGLNVLGVTPVKEMR